METTERMRKKTTNREKQEMIVGLRFTARSACGSLPPRPSLEHLSDDELEDVIRKANEQHARKIMEELEAE